MLWHVYLECLVCNKTVNTYWQEKVPSQSRNSCILKNDVGFRILSGLVYDIIFNYNHFFSIDYKALFHVPVYQLRQNLLCYVCVATVDWLDSFGHTGSIIIYLVLELSFILNLFYKNWTRRLCKITISGRWIHLWKTKKIVIGPF